MKFGRCDMRIPYISLLAAGALALGGCADYYGGGLGYGSYYGGYGGYYGSPYYGGYYGSPYYGDYYDYGYGMPYYGWYDDYYYPGSGIYVYDTYRRPHVMTTRQRTYWTSRSPRTTTTVTTNWSGFDRRNGRHHTH
jgi:hypothetical protein